MSGGTDKDPYLVDVDMEELGYANKILSGMLIELNSSAESLSESAAWWSSKEDYQSEISALTCLRYIFLRVVRAECAGFACD